MRTVSRPWRLALLVAALGLLGTVAGCGNSPLSAADLRSQAGNICTSASKATQRIPGPRGPGGTQAFLRRGLAILEPELSQLRGLNPGTAQADQYHAAVDAFARQVAALRRTERELGRGADPTGALKTLQGQIGAQEAQENSAWQALGIPACLSH